MASRINTTFNSVLLAVAIIGIFMLLVTKHYELSEAKLQGFGREAMAASTIAGAKLGVLDPCDDDETLTVFSATVYLCDEPTDALVFEDIYNLYPASAGGNETIYSFMNEGEKDRADEMVQDIYFIERYEPVKLPAPLSWTEDPFNERYWRFIFYSLRPMRHLLATAEETGAERYYAKTREITESFIDNGMDEVHAWDDPHGVSFRTMMLVNIWWKLRAAGELPSELSDKILRALEIHGDFLLDPENYEGDYNHAITQSAALLLLAQNFPDLANADAWRETAIRRLNVGLSSIIDPNGVLVENSPFYHFYVLEKYWEIYQYAKENSISISNQFDETMDSMIRFATYVLQPDDSVPQLGASTPRTILRSGEYREMAELYPEFRYVLTQGQTGEQPETRNQLFPSSGMVIMRSGWGTDRPFIDESYALFDTGPYRTDHSDLDALTVMLYGDETPIIRDAGLFTYETEHPFYDYFHGTRGHNTVMVNGQDQPEGSGKVRSIVSTDETAYAAAWQELYPGVRHSRSVALLGTDAMLVVDELTSETSHSYEQLWHLPIGSKIERQSETALTATTEDGVPIRITQVLPGTTLETYTGQTEPPRGWCADGYEERQPCPELSFGRTGTTTRYITLITYGEAAEADIAFDQADSLVKLTTPLNEYQIEVEFPDMGILNSAFISLDLQSRTGDSASFISEVRSWLSGVF